MKIYTIGFTKKTAEEFFTLLKQNQITKMFDIRRNNKSQLAGFTKKDDLRYFLDEILKIGYEHMLFFAPNQEFLSKYKKKEIDWDEFEQLYIQQLQTIHDFKNLDIDAFDQGCLLCSEASATKCHRRLLAEFLKKKFPEKQIEIHHL